MACHIVGRPQKMLYAYNPSMSMYNVAVSQKSPYVVDQHHRDQRTIFDQCNDMYIIFDGDNEIHQLLIVALIMVVTVSLLWLSLSVCYRCHCQFVIVVTVSLSPSLFYHRRLLSFLLSSHQMGHE
jgi:hypothetical protein